VTPKLIKGMSFKWAECITSQTAHSCFSGWWRGGFFFSACSLSVWLFHDWFSRWL